MPRIAFPYAKYDSRGELSVKQWIESFNLTLHSNRIPDAFWVATLLNQITDSVVVIRLSKMLKSVDESHYHHFARVLIAFLIEYEVSPGILAARQQAVHDMYIGVEENIEDYYRRFEWNVTDAFPDREMHNEDTFNLFIHTLDEDAKREAMRWI